MKETILKKLKEIESKENIEILFANESGSRAWGFPSPDSDYDVRFIYIQPMQAYLSISNKADHLSFPINDELDIYGWDLKKVLQLIFKSNTTPFEWLQSPLIYMEKEGFRQRLFTICEFYFNPRKNALHYLGIARSALSTMLSEDEIKVKKLFYVLRPLLAAKWCLVKNAIAPMTMQKLMELMPNTFKNEVNRLISEKASQKEGFIIKISPELKAYIENEFLMCESEAEKKPNLRFSYELLDNYFIETLKKDDN